MAKNRKRRNSRNAPQENKAEISRDIFPEEEIVEDNYSEDEIFGADLEDIVNEYYSINQMDDDINDDFDEHDDIDDLNLDSFYRENDFDDKELSQEKGEQTEASASQKKKRGLRTKAKKGEAKKETKDLRDPLRPAGSELMSQETGLRGMFKDKESRKEIIFPALALFLITMGITFLLALTNQVTADKIAEQNELKSSELQKIVLPQAEKFEEIGVEIRDLELENYQCYQGVDASGQRVGYVFITERKGYGGVIKVMTAFDLENKITGVQILESSETAGLGLKANEDWYLERYKGATNTVYLVNHASENENEAEAITGATITSRAVTGAVNDARDLYNIIINNMGGEVDISNG